MKRQDKFAKAIGIIILALTVIASAVFYLMPFNEPTFDKESMTVHQTGSGYQYYISGYVTNDTNVTITGLKFEISIYKNDNYVTTKTISMSHDIDPGDTEKFITNSFIMTEVAFEYAEFYVESIEYTYEQFPWYFIVLIGIVLWSLIQLLFAKRKYYFNINDKKVVVYASFKKAAVIVDGVLIKQGKLPSFRQEVAQFNMQIDGQSLTIYTLNGAPVPSVRITVNRVDVKYTKVRQNPFVKLMDEGVVIGSGNTEMRSRYEIEGEAADKYNEQRRQERLNAEQGGQPTQPTQPQVAKKFCPYCGCENDASNSKCSGCGANLHG